MKFAFFSRLNVLISGKDFIYPDTKDFEYSKKSYNNRIKSAQNSARLLGIEMEFLVRNLILEKKSLAVDRQDKNY